MDRLIFGRSLATWAVVIAVALLILFLLSVRAGCRQAESTRKAEVVGEELDRVAKEVPAIRDEQRKKEDEVDQIEGADQPLPPGFGAELERVRRGGRDPRES